MLDLKSFLIQQKKQKKIIYPHSKNWFKAFELTPFDKVRVVILGQDPYHGEKQAHGLSFSVPQNIKAPPSLKNIFKEINNDLQIDNKTTDLTPWAKQGVLLLNSVLTVEKNSPASHSNKGWEVFTDKVISLLNQHKKGIVFLLWGAYAQSKSILIDTNKHLILKAVHPSPLSAYRGFFGCKHFSKTNNYLSQPINWKL
ncbi:Uracil-DNA glycosylase, family 1 [hydrothermal vent metagenome]|uniref:uracil-DNA glycosylase n=1 Tax=hydrothermal vent metagenome TaxID=652676 RepID=A0A1W1BP20_9ZZZZ